ncbi:MAG: DUF6110 family protein [Oscillospiraceae bacterium]|jgi:hypothetical protein|nr:DUF6110 family protein [Oscillospiraceae bacterium]
MSLPDKKSVLTFVGGAAAAIFGAKFAKSRTAHKIAVHGVANGLRIKDDALKTIESIREEAQDIYEEAKRRDAAARTGE